MMPEYESDLLLPSIWVSRYDLVSLSFLLKEKEFWSLWPELNWDVMSDGFTLVDAETEQS